MGVRTLFNCHTCIFRFPGTSSTGVMEVGYASLDEDIHVLHADDSDGGSTAKDTRKGM